MIARWSGRSNCGANSGTGFSVHQGDSSDVDCEIPYAKSKSNEASPLCIRSVLCHGNTQPITVACVVLDDHLRLCLCKHRDNVKVA